MEFLYIYIYNFYNHSKFLFLKSNCIINIIKYLQFEQFINNLFFVHLNKFLFILKLFCIFKIHHFNHLNSYTLYLIFCVESIL